MIDVVLQTIQVVVAGVEIVHPAGIRGLYRKTMSVRILPLQP